MARTTIVIPCFNEAARLETQRFVQYAIAAPDIDFVMVDDGSTDNTLERLEILRRFCPAGFRVLQLPTNRGKAEAVRQGLLHALEGGPDYVGYWDADLATPLEAIESFVGVLDRRAEIDAVIGTRLPLLGRSVERRPLRGALGRLFAHVASRVLGTSIRDTQCGAKLFRATPSLPHVLRTPFLARWIFDVEIFARLIATSRQQAGTPSLSQSLYELPLEQWREVGRSTLRRGDFIRAIGDLTKIYLRYLGPGASWSPTDAGLEPEAMRPAKEALPAEQRRRAA